MIKLDFFKYELKNGLRFIEVPLEKTGAIALLVSVNAGSRFEGKNNWGIAHFIEHMFFKGGKKYKTKKDVATVIDSIGGNFNARTGKEEVDFFIKIPATKTEIGFSILSDMLLNSTFKENDIKQEKRIITEEINMYEDSPMFQTTELLQRILFKGSSLEQEIIGKKETINNFHTSDFLNFKKKHYFAQNMVVVAAGDTSKISVDLISDLFKFSPGQVRLAKKPNEIQKSPQSIVKYKETEQSHLSIGFRFPETKYGHNGFFKAEVLSALLGEGMSSRLFLSIRENKGLAYRIRSFTYPFTDTGYLEISAGVDNKKAQKAIKGILRECKKLKEKEVGKKELLKAKEYLKGRLILELEDSLDAAFFIGGQELLAGKILSIEEIFEKIDEVGSLDILKIANQNFKNNKLNMALIGPFKEKERSSLEKILTV